MRISDWSSDVCSSDLSGGDRIERPKRHPARQPVEQAHPGQAGLADLRRADEVEIADARRLLRRALILLDDSEAPRPGRKEIADFAAAVATMRSEERRVGKEGFSTCRSRWSPYH